MGNAYVSEFCNLAYAGNPRQPVMAPQLPADVDQPVIAFGGSSVQSAAMGNATRFVMINVDSACSIAVGDDPVADPTKARLGPNETRFYGIKAGQKIAFIENT